MVDIETALQFCATWQRYVPRRRVAMHYENSVLYTTDNAMLIAISVAGEREIIHRNASKWQKRLSLDFQIDDIANLAEVNVEHKPLCTVCAVCDCCGIRSVIRACPDCDGRKSDCETCPLSNGYTFDRDAKCELCQGDGFALQYRCGAAHLAHCYAALLKSFGDVVLSPKRESEPVSFRVDGGNFAGTYGLVMPVKV